VLAENIICADCGQPSGNPSAAAAVVAGVLLPGWALTSTCAPPALSRIYATPHTPADHRLIGLARPSTITAYDSYRFTRGPASGWVIGVRPPEGRSARDARPRG
jgi:hypothetical protein